MALNRDTHIIKFVFQNTNGVFYDIEFNAATGVGVGRKHGTTYKTTPMYNATETALTVDAGSLTAWKGYHVSRRIHAAVYNTTSALNTILNAAS